MKELIYGKDQTEGVVAVEYKNDKVTLFLEDDFGVRHKEIPFKPWLLTKKSLGVRSRKLMGNGAYSYCTEFDTEQEFNEAKCRVNFYQRYCPRHMSEAIMQKTGITLFKGFNSLEDVSVLSFDIETNGITMDDSSQVYFISNTYRHGNTTKKKLFSFKDYRNQGEMINEWCKWVTEINPSILLGHNIFGFDLPYLINAAGQYGVKLNLGRDGSTIQVSEKTSLFRKDGSQSYDYHDMAVYGRQVIDTFFLAIKYDIGRKYESYGLKQIIKQEGLEKEDRQHYDATQIGKLIHDPVEYEKIKAYAEDDADDALSLFYLMAPSFYYYTQSIPRSFQQIINTASGSQLNSFMIRAYLQEGRSIPEGSEKAEYEGAISYGNPGIYRDVYKVDVASLYPSIILMEDIFNRSKDPQGYFLRMVRYFTEERLKNKQLGKDTGDRYYKDLEQSQKIMINSAYGFLGAPKLNFNSPEDAAKITRVGRQILQKGIAWAETRGFKIVNVDTDSFSYTTGEKHSESEFEGQISQLNHLFPNEIRWENDGYYERFLVIKAKNYALRSGDKLKIKGSALKATMKEPKLKRFIKDCIDILMTGSLDLREPYNCMAREIIDIKDITGWCNRKTITKSVLNPKRTNEQRVLDAIGNKHVQEGDKIHIFFKSATELCLKEDFDGTYDKDKLLEKLFKTAKIFENVIVMNQYPNYKLKRNKILLEKL